MEVKGARRGDKDQIRGRKKNTGEEGRRRGSLVKRDEDLKEVKDGK